MRGPGMSLLVAACGVSVGHDRRRMAIVDSQSAKSAEWASPLEAGYDAGKHIKGIKRHLAVDVEGFLPAMPVTCRLSRAVSG